MPAKSTAPDMPEWPQIKASLDRLKWQDPRVPVLLRYKREGEWNDFLETLEPAKQGLKAIHDVARYKQRAMQAMYIADFIEPYIRQIEKMILAKANELGISIKEETVTRFIVE